MPKLYNKIQTSIKNQKYINGFMKDCGYTQDDDISSFLMWMTQKFNITYGCFKQAFDNYVKQQENKNTFMINDNYTNDNNKTANNTDTINKNENFIKNKNTQMQTQTNNDYLSAPTKPKYNLFHCLDNNYIGYDDNGCHCCCLW